MSAKRRRGRLRSAPSDVPAGDGAASTAPVPARWIVGAVPDLILFVGTPLLILPLVMLAERHFTTQQIYIFVASFGAVGHHLPGMIRAYGDRSLFRRFRVRFIVAPLFLLSVCTFFAFHARPALILVVFLWSTWHGLMQIHGFARIYDSKARSFARTTVYLDQWLCISWFVAAIAWSPKRVHWILDHFFQSGGALGASQMVPYLRAGTGALVVVVTLLWIGNALRSWRAGNPPSPVKVLLLATSIGFYLYAQLVVADLLIAVVLWEIFHDVQYLSIVWLFNRRRVSDDPAVGRFTSFLFRPSVLLVGLYVAFCFVYGSLNIAAEILPGGLLTTLLAGYLAASATFHFYIDGFIWRVGEPDTRHSLGIEDGKAIEPPRARFPSWARHGLKWVVWFVIPVAALGVVSARPPASDEDRVMALSAVFPTDAVAQRNRAVALYKDGDLEGAIEAGRKAAALAPLDEAMGAEIRRELASFLAEAAMKRLAGDDLEGAVPLLREAATHDRGVLDRVGDAGVAANRRGDYPKAIAYYTAVLQVDPDHGLVHYNLAVTYAAQGRLQAARRHAELAVQLLPGKPEPSEALRRIEEGIARGPIR